MATSTERSANGNCVASPHTALPVRARLVIASVSARSMVTSDRSTWRVRARSRARAAMSPMPLPTSSRVARAPSWGSTAPTSSRTARVPPNSAFANATSASERRTIRGSTSGASRYSVPRRRGGVIKVFTRLLYGCARSALELRVPTAVVEQWPVAVRDRRLDLPNEDRVIARVVVRVSPALDVSERIVEERCAGEPARVADAVEAAPLVQAGEPARQRLLVHGENIHREMRHLQQDVMRRSRVVDAHQDQRRNEARRAERAHCHSVIAAVAVTRRHHCDSRREPSEYAAERVGIDHHDRSEFARGAVTSAPPSVQGTTRRRRKPARSTSRAGTKSPVTPTMVCAIHGRSASERAAMFMREGKLTAVPIIRSTAHFPLNSRTRAWSYDASDASASDGDRAASASTMCGARSSAPRNAA